MLQFIINGIIAGSIYALVGLGFSLVYSTARFFHFAHGAIYTLGAYLTFTFLVVFGISFPVSIFLAICVSAIIGTGIEFLIYRRMREQGAGNLSLLIASLGLLIVLQNLVSLVWGDETKTIRSGLVSEGFNILGARVTSIQVIIIAVSCSLAVLLWFFLHKTFLGIKLRAVANDPDLSKIHGIDSNKIILLAFFLGSILAAGAAILISLDTDMTPTMGFYALLMGVTAAIVGGIGKIWGALLGGLLIGLIQHLGVWKLPTEWQETIVFIVLILGSPLKRTEV
jgi:branched-chain amino acid transport system permease protein